MAGVGHLGALAPNGSRGNPLQRLDETMVQTPDWRLLRALLGQQPQPVRDVICMALDHELGRIFQNMAGQFHSYKAFVDDIKDILKSEEASALENLMQDIHPSLMRALEREAVGINEDIDALRRAVQNGDKQAISSRTNLMANKAKRFRDRYAEFRPKLETLRKRLEQVKIKCATEARRSEKLIAQTAQRALSLNPLLTGFGALRVFFSLIPAHIGLLRAFLGRTFGDFLENLGWISAGAYQQVAFDVRKVAGLGAAAVTSIALMRCLAQRAATLGRRSVLATGTSVAAALAEASSSTTVGLSTSLCSTSPLLFLGTLAIGWFVLGKAGRALVKKVLAGLWVSEMQLDKRASVVFQDMAEATRIAASKLKASEDKNKELEQCFDLVVEVAEDLEAKADDALQMTPMEAEAEMAILHQQVEKLVAQCEKVPQAFEHLHSSLAELQPAVQRVKEVALLPDERRAALTFGPRGPRQCADQWGNGGSET